MNKAEYFLRRHSPTILAIAAASGVVVTSILSAKATPKALALISEAEKNKGEELTVVETIQAGWKPYIPAVLAGASTICCIFGLKYVTAKTQASLVSAYMLLDSTFKDYREKTSALYGEDADTIIRNEVIKSKIKGYDLQTNTMLFFDFNSMRYYQKTMDEVLAAEAEFLEAFHARGYACLNEYYDCLGEPRVAHGYQLGWFDIENNDPYNCKELEFVYERTLIGNDVECWTISTNQPPALDYII
jgi:hypothetical protein